MVALVKLCAMVAEFADYSCHRCSSFLPFCCKVRQTRHQSCVLADVGSSGLCHLPTAAVGVLCWLVRQAQAQPTTNSLWSWSVSLGRAYCAALYSTVENAGCGVQRRRLPLLACAVDCVRVYIMGLFRRDMGCQVVCLATCQWGWKYALSFQLILGFGRE